MKKAKISTVVMIVLVVALAISIWQNISYAKERNSARGLLMNQVHSSFRNISLQLDGLIHNIDEMESDEYYRYSQRTIIQISNNLVVADALLSQYRGYFSDVRLDYGSTFSNFEYISYTLSGDGGTANDIVYESILQDPAISEKEVRYLTALRDDIESIYMAMESADSSPQEDKNLTTAQLSVILNAFFDKWSPHNENSPFFLLIND